MPVFDDVLGENGLPLHEDLVRVDLYVVLGRKFMSCSNCQELGQLADLTSVWLFTLVQPIVSELAC